MAYTFRRLDEGLGLRPSDALLNPAAAQPQKELKPGAQVPAGGAGDLAISAAGAADPSKGNLAEQGVGSEQYTKAASADPMKFVTANQDAKFGSVIEPVKTATADATAALQRKANEYVAAVPKFDEVDAAAIDEATGKGGAAFDRISKALAAQYQAPTAPEVALPPTSDEVEALRSVQGREALLRRTGGASYTKGMSQLDQALFQQTGAYKQQLAEAEAAQRAMVRASDEARARMTAAAEEGGRTFAERQNLLRQNLGNVASGLTETVDKRVAEETARRRAEDTAARIQAKSALQAEIDKRLSDIESRRGQRFADRNTLDRATAQLKDLGGNLDSLISSDSYKLDRGNVVTADEAARFNRIMSLLGKNESLGPAGGGRIPERVAAAYDPAVLAAADDLLRSEAEARAARLEEIERNKNAPRTPNPIRDRMDRPQTGPDSPMGQLQRAGGYFADAAAKKNELAEILVKDAKALGGGVTGGAKSAAGSATSAGKSAGKKIKRLGR